MPASMQALTSARMRARTPARTQASTQKSMPPKTQAATPTSTRVPTRPTTARPRIDFPRSDALRLPGRAFSPNLVGDVAEIDAGRGGELPRAAGVPDGRSVRAARHRVPGRSVGSVGGPGQLPRSRLPEPGGDHVQG